MKATSRSWRVIAGLAISLAALVGLPPSASGAYVNEPAPQAWTAPGPVHALEVVGGHVYVGFYDAGTGSGGIAALDAASGAFEWSASTDGDVRALAVSSNGTRVLAGGKFITVNGTRHRHLVALTAADGSVVTNWRAATGGQVRDLVVDGDTLYVGGTFGATNGVSQRGLGAVYVSTGNRVASFTASVDKNVYGLAKTGSTLIASGSFTLVNNTPRRSLASFDLATGELTTWAPARICSGCHSYWDIAVDAQNVYVGSSGPGGQFAAFDLVTGRQPWPYIHADGDVQAVTVADDGMVYIGGHFAQFVKNTNNPRTLLAAIDPGTGDVAPDFAPKLYTSWPGVWALSASPSTLYAGGDLTGVRSGGYNNHVPYFAAFSA